MTAVYRAEVIGSMLRPRWLKQARTVFAADRISTGQFKRIEDRAVDDAIALQERCGLDVVTDGDAERKIVVLTAAPDSEDETKLRLAILSGAPDPASA